MNILLIEDDPDARDALQALLELDGYDVSAAEDGPRALALAAQTPPRVALVDIGLPGMDGYEVARRLRESFGKRALIIALTGYGQAEDKQKAAEAGFDTHLVKPVDPTELSKILGQLLDRS